MQTATIASYSVLLLFGVIAFFFTHYVGHRLAHIKLRLWRIFYNAHIGEKSRKGHHLVYLPSTHKTSRYLPIAYRNAIDVFMAIPWTLGLYWLLPRSYFVTIFVEVLTLGIVFSYVHASTHLTEHWLNRVAFYRRMKAKHMLHHDNMACNFGFGLDFFDRLFGTFKPVESRR